MTLPKHHLITLDLLRAAAALMVLLVHTRGGAFVEYGALPEAQRTSIVAIAFAITRLGQESVMLFFVLSGFLVGGGLLLKLRNNTFNLRNYVTDRTVRIFLPLIPACFLASFLHRLIDGTPILTFGLLANVVGLGEIVVPVLQANAPLWSLFYEIWFYILGGAVAYLFWSKGSSIAAAGTFAICCVAFSRLNALYLMYWCFAAMMILFKESKMKNTWLFAFGFTIMLVGITTFQLAFPSKSFTNVYVVQGDVARTLMTLGAAMCLPFLCTERLNVLCCQGRMGNSTVRCVLLYALFNALSRQLCSKFSFCRKRHRSPLTVSVVSLPD